MRIGIAGKLIRLYPQDDQEQNIADRIVRFQRRNFRYIHGARCVPYRLPEDAEALKYAMKALIGQKRGEFMFQRVLEKMEETL